MEDTISQAKSDFIRAKDRLVRALATTPDDRVDWSPSTTARTPIQQVAHCAMSVKVFGGILAGRPHEFRGVLEEERFMRESERTYTSRAQVLDALEENSREYLAWLDTLNPEMIASEVSTPFGPMTLSKGFAILAGHLNGHTAQIDYIQTIYGDLDWHLPG